MSFTTAAAAAVAVAATTHLENDEVESHLEVVAGAQRVSLLDQVVDPRRGELLPAIEHEMEHLEPVEPAVANEEAQVVERDQLSALCGKAVAHHRPLARAQFLEQLGLRLGIARVHEPDLQLGKLSNLGLSDHGALVAEPKGASRDAVVEVLCLPTADNDAEARKLSSLRVVRRVHDLGHQLGLREPLLLDAETAVVGVLGLQVVPDALVPVPGVVLCQSLAASRAADAGVPPGRVRRSGVVGQPALADLVPGDDEVLGVDLRHALGVPQLDLVLVVPDVVVVVVTAEVTLLLRVQA